jgi:gamma-glutamyl hercynylcysteine S-oxide synthase
MELAETAARGDLRRQLASDLEEARKRTHRLLEPLDDERLTVQFDPLMSPPVWDYAHIGAFEELWLVRQLSAAPPMLEDSLERTYNALDTPRVARGKVKLLNRAETLAYLEEVRRRALALLEEVDFDAGDRLLRDGFLYDLVIQHEHQHDETILQELQLMPGEYLSKLPSAPVGPAVEADMVDVPAGRYPIGSNLHEPYDNEHPRHEVELASFRIDRFPVTNGDFLAFMADGGYSREELWSRDGWDWNMTFGTGAPEYWFDQERSWFTRRYGLVVPVEPQLPVAHVCYFEADAYARWAGKRLPTEAEWEVAAGWDPAESRQRRFPWGDAPPTPELANLDQALFGATAIGAYPKGASGFGCEQMLGDVWEWTSSDFLPYPGFEAFPYSEYSEPFFGSTFKVLRGGSWATRPRVARNTFRNWDHPIKRQIFAGLRCAASG